MTHYPASVADWRRQAERRLPRFLFDYIDGGASDERTLAANVQDFAALRLRQRVLVDVAQVDTRATLAGQPCALPLALAPIGLAGMAASGARPALIRAAQVLARPGWVRDVALRGQPLRFGNLTAQVPGARDLGAFKAWVDAQFDPSVTWKDIDWLRGQWKGRPLLKGILDVQDAQAAVQVGADGIVVSNHGGRQLDSVASTAAKLPAIAQAVGAQTEVLVDGGVRSGVDVFKALALGARGVLIGRPWVWALAAQGEAGVRTLLAQWQRELLLAMTLAGVTRVADIGPQHLDTD